MLPSVRPEAHRKTHSCRRATDGPPGAILHCDVRKSVKSSELEGRLKSSVWRRGRRCKSSTTCAPCDLIEMSCPNSDAATVSRTAMSFCSCGGGWDGMLSHPKRRVRTCTASARPPGESKVRSRSWRDVGVVRGTISRVEVLTLLLLVMHSAL